jgi:beta-glucosidase
MDSSDYSYQKYPQSLQLSRESVVLLKNSGNLLPLSINIESKANTAAPKPKIAVIGPNADNIYNQIGDYSPPIKAGSGYTIAAGINELLSENYDILNFDNNKINYIKSDHFEEDLNSIKDIAAQSDLVILVLGGSSSRFTNNSWENIEFDSNGAAIINKNVFMDCGEGVDSSSINLPGWQDTLFDEVKKMGKPVITVMIQGRPYAIPEIAEKTDALLTCFYPGPLGGLAIAEILTGKISPSGRLPVSVPRNVGQIPVYYNLKNSYKAMKYCDVENTPLFTFGEGFGYGKFEYSNFTVSNMEFTTDELHKKTISVDFTVQNIGIMADTAVPQLYVQDLCASVIPRVRELKNFSKVALLPDECKNISLELGYTDFCIWDANMNFNAEEGQFKLFLMDNNEVLFETVVSLKES